MVKVFVKAMSVMCTPLLLVLLSCDSAHDTVSLSADAAMSDSGSANNFREVWICYNPSSPFHGETCGASCFYQIDSEDDAFCWLLERAQCTPPLRLQWQKDNCHHFE